MSSLRSAYEKSRVIGPLHTGGPAAVDYSGTHIATCVGEEVIVTRLSDGLQLHRLVTDGEDVHSICFTPSSSHILVFTASLALHIFENPCVPSPDSTLHPSRTIAKAHDAPVHVCKADSTSTLLASGSADGVVKVWDIRRGYVTHVFRGHGGVVSAITFRRAVDPSMSVTAEPVLQLVTASVDTKLRVFDLSAKAAQSGVSKPIAILEGHASVPRGLDITPDGRWLVSGGRDAVAFVWDFDTRQSGTASSSKKGVKKEHGPTLVRTIPIHERVEAAGWICTSENSQRQFFTAGEKGIIKIWNAETSTLSRSLEPEFSEKSEIVFADYIAKAGVVMAIDSDHILSFYSVATGQIVQQLVGYNDEIVATSFLSSRTRDTHIAVATNSPVLRVYSNTGNDTRLLSGHSEIVLCLDSSLDGHLLASGSKDNSARLWAYAESSESWTCFAKCEGHAESVGAIALSRRLPENPSSRDNTTFVCTGSQDRTIKMWNVPIGERNDDTELIHLKSLVTIKAHDKDINALDVSPNDSFLASGSQDKTAKIFKVAYHSDAKGGPKGNLELLGTCKGHKRGVWSVKFGKAERVLATGSGDTSVKLWNLDDFTCVKTFEGHSNSVLQLCFLNHDLQMVSTASDGLLKLWNIKSEECMATMDNHEDKVWALSVSSDEAEIITGAADSVLTFWKDCTEEKERERQAKREDAVLREQDLLNYIAIKDYHNAIVLALSLDQPGRLLSLFKQVFTVKPPRDLQADGGTTGVQANLNVALKRLSPPELMKLLRHIRDWNANAKTSTVAQTILNVLLKLWTVDQIVEAFNWNTKPANDPTIPIDKSNSSLTLNELVQALLPYSERHLARLDRLIQDSYIIDYILKEMDGGLITEDSMHIDV